MKTIALPLIPRFEPLMLNEQVGAPGITVSSLPAPTVPPNAAFTSPLEASLHGDSALGGDAEGAPASVRAARRAIGNMPERGATDTSIGLDDFASQATPGV